MRREGQTHVQALTKKLRGATKTLTKRQATRKKIG